MEDRYHWAKSQGLYVEQDALASWLHCDREAAATAVLDCRDDDYAGGHIAGSLHTPDANFDAVAVIARLREARVTRAVLHCMESARRGPRCAYRLHQALQHEADEEAAPGIDLHILRGGADLWLRRFVREDPSLVDAFDNDYWGWPADGTQGPRIRQAAGEAAVAATAAAVDAPSHSLYNRPTDQPATDWSSGGAHHSQP